MNYLLRTLGCKANLYDSQLIEAELRKRGWNPYQVGEPCADGDNLKLCIVNSCTVTDEADRQSRKMAAKLGRDHPEAAVVITGCAAEVDPERLANSKGIHYVVGNIDKPQMVELILKKLESPAGVGTAVGRLAPLPPVGEILGGVKNYTEFLSRHPMDREWPEVSDSFFSAEGVSQSDSLTSTTRAFLKIQEGCNSFCTYCIIPYGRGPSRSLKPREILDQLKRLVDSGIREVVLTGTNIGDYGTDWSEKAELGTLLKMMLTETSIERVRVSSLDPTEITSEIFEIAESNPRFCPHFHVSLQSASDRVLRLMKRKYGTSQIQDCLKKIAELKAPPGGAFIGMDIITGFPGETEAQFQDSVKLLKALPWSRLHVFPYSERAGTPATRLPEKVKSEVRSQRARILNDLSIQRIEDKHATLMSQKDLVLDRVLLERVKNGPPGSAGAWFAGYTPHYLRVYVEKSHSLARNQLIRVRPKSFFIDRAAGDAAFIADPV